MENIDNILTLEVKNEIAKRYFGFRKIIEEDTAAYFEKIKKTALKLEQTVGHDLVRIYNLLNNQDLLKRFFVITGLPERIFYDAFINTSPVKNEIMRGQKLRGFTRKGCLHNMFFDAYARLFRDIQEFRKSFAELVEDHDTICEQIRIFYRKNDIETIFSFLRGLDNTSLDIAATTFSGESRMSMEAKLRLEPPPPVAELLPEIPAIPGIKTARKKLKSLVTQACIQQPRLDLRPGR